jgi:Holliday junction resolvasome RuvABC ATP-dependent DNA helicase subunit
VRPVEVSTYVRRGGETIEEVYEPFLIQEGYLKRTSH